MTDHSSKSPGFENALQSLERMLPKVDRVIDHLRIENGEEIRRHAKRSPEERRLAASGHLIHRLKAKDTTGRRAYYFVLVPPERETAFLRAIEGDGTIDLEAFGQVVASCYGEAPTREVLDFLKEKYAFDLRS